MKKDIPIEMKNEVKKINPNNTRRNVLKFTIFVKKTLKHCNCFSFHISFVFVFLAVLK